MAESKFVYSKVNAVSTTLTFTQENGNFSTGAYYTYDPVTGMAIVHGTIIRDGTAGSSIAEFAFDINGLTIDETRLPNVGGIERMAIGSIRQVDLTAAGDFHGILTYRQLTNKIVPDTPGGTATYSNFGGGEHLTLFAVIPVNEP